jgi:hypothetical protein
MAASATFALKAGVWFRRGLLLIISPDSRANLARRQAETPLGVRAPGDCDHLFQLIATRRSD